MPRLEDQLAALAQRLDDAVEPVRADDMLVAEAVPVTTFRPRRRVVLAIASAVALAASVALGITIARDRREPRRPPGAAATTRASTSPTTTATPQWRLLSSGPLPESAWSRPLTKAVVTDATRWRALWAPSLAPNVDFAQDVAILVEPNNACEPLQQVTVADGIVRIAFEPSRVGCPFSPRRIAIAVQRSAFADTVTVRPSVALSGDLVVPLRARDAFGVLGDIAPVRVACVPEHAPNDIYSLREVTELALEGRTLPIVPGNPITKPSDVTLDSMGVMPGAADPQGGSVLLWGAATAGGPFAGLDRAAIGAAVTLTQSDPSYRGPGQGLSCTQQWKVAAIGTAPIVDSHPVLRLVGFAPHGASGPETLFYADLVPA
jgi:hypothetical protein